MTAGTLSLLVVVVAFLVLGGAVLSTLLPLLAHVSAGFVR